MIRSMDTKQIGNQNLIHSDIIFGVCFKLNDIIVLIQPQILSHINPVHGLIKAWYTASY